jgi:hypothetical protein
MQKSLKQAIEDPTIVLIVPGATVAKFFVDKRSRSLSTCGIDFL